MGNVDTKLNFRKAIVQLGAKNQVSVLHTFVNSMLEYLKYHSDGF